MSVAPEIIGRDEELGAVRAFISRVGDGPGALVLSGEAGIGKTILWEAGVEEARARFGRVLTCRGVEAEASLPLPGLSELLAGVVRRWRRRSCRRVGVRSRSRCCSPSPATTAPDRARRSGLPCSTALQALADHGGPVLVAVDDAQWLDPASASVHADRVSASSRGADRPAGDRQAGARGRRAASSSTASSRTSGWSGSRSARSRSARCIVCSRSGSGSS